MAAWHGHSVLLFARPVARRQELIASAGRLGDLDFAPDPGNRRGVSSRACRDLHRLHVKVNGEPIGSLGDGERSGTPTCPNLDVPPKASMLYSLEIPPDRPATPRSAPCTACTTRCPRNSSTRIAGLKIKHDGTYNAAAMCAGRHADR